jgi:Zn-dependent protease
VPIPPLDGSRVLYYFGNWRLREFMTRIEPYGWFIYIGLFFVLGAGRLLEPIYMAFMNIFVHLPEIVWGLR